MNVLFNLLCSLVLTTIVTFVTPLIMTGILLLTLTGASYISGWETLMGLIENNILEFLAIFGNGDALRGILIIAATCALVGGLFDLFNFYRYQNLGGHW